MAQGNKWLVQYTYKVTLPAHDTSLWKELVAHYHEVEPGTLRAALSDIEYAHVDGMEIIESYLVEFVLAQHHMGNYTELVEVVANNSYKEA